MIISVGIFGFKFALQVAKDANKEFEALIPGTVFEIWDML